MCCSARWLWSSAGKPVRRKREKARVSASSPPARRSRVAGLTRRWRGWAGTGMLFDAEGNRMTPTHAVKQGTRYRYYVSRPLITQDQLKRSTGLRIRAAEVEQLVSSRVRQWLLDPGGLYHSTQLPDLSAQRRVIARAGEIGKSWTELPGTRQR